MKVQAVEDMKELYHHKNERLQRRDLMRLTWTTKHRWFGKGNARKRQGDQWTPMTSDHHGVKRTVRERPYL